MISVGVLGGGILDAAMTREDSMAKAAVRSILNVVIDEIQELSDLTRS